MLISVLNQLVSSGTHFFLGLYLVRTLTPAEFGLYGIGFAVCLFYSGIGNALFLTQMVVNTPDKLQADQLRYAASMLMVVILFGAITIFCTWLVFVGGESGLFWRGDYASFGIAVVAASVSYLLKDFFIRHAYTVRKEAWALAVSCMVAATLAGMLLFEHYSGSVITAERALWLYAISQLVGAGVGFALAQLPLSSIAWRHVQTDFREAWPGGRWAIGGVSVTWAQSQAYMYVTAWFAGPAGVGHANAARLLVVPITFLVSAIHQVVMPRLAELRTHNRSGMLQVGGVLMIGLLAMAISYSAVLLSLVDYIARIVLGSQYEQMFPLAAAWCLVLSLELIRSSAGVLLQVLKRFRTLTLMNAASGCVAIASSVALMLIMGVSGAILGTAVGELILAVLLWKVVWNERG